MPPRWFFALLALPYLCVFPYVRALNNPNELVRVYTVMAIVEGGTYRIDEQVESFGHVEDMAHVEGHYVMVKAPGATHLGVPVYALFSRVFAPALGLRYPTPAALDALSEDAAEWARLRWTRAATWTLRLFVSQLPALLFLVWFERYLRAFSPDFVLRAAAVLALGLGTNFLAYAHMFASHTLYACAAFMAFGLVESEQRAPSPSPGRRAALAGFLTSGCVALEYQALLPALVLCVFALSVFRRRSAAFLLAALANVPPVMWFQRCAYGDALSPGHKLLENARFASEHRSGFWGISWPAGKAIAALVFDPGFGLFALSPFLCLGLLALPLGLFRPRRPTERTTALVWCAMMLAALLVNAGFVEWRAGWTVGARYLVVGAPFFAFGGLRALEHLARGRRALTRGVGLGLAFSGVVAIGTVGLLVDTLPDTIGRPFAQFFVPMVRSGFVAHDAGEWIGAPRGIVFYLTCALLLAAPILFVLHRGPATVLAFTVAATAGLVPAFTRPADGSALFTLHPSTTFFARDWEPPRGSALFGSEGAGRRPRGLATERDRAE